MKQDPEKVQERRGFLKAIGVGGALPLAPGLVAGAAGGAAFGAAAQTPPPTTGSPQVNEVFGYTCFSADEAALVETMVNIMCPADEYTPNGVDCGLAIYMDRQLSGAFGKADKRYMKGPWAEGVPQQGWQLPMTPEAYFRLGAAAAAAASVAKAGKPFDQLDAAAANVFLLDLAAGKHDGDTVKLSVWFRDVIYPLFNQACFADPIYGGNVGKVFWKMIGYPGLPATNTINMVQYRGKPFPGAKDPKSIADFS
jgi:gluconate 2-dehydrogenase gamma chain